jgi:sigma-B regulation protein RsbU (phosphoserine phosphatase)
MTQTTAPVRSRWFSRLSYPQKFIIISLIFILPLLAFGPLIYQQVVRIDQYGTKEYYGTLYLRPLQQFLVAVQRHEQLIARKWRNVDVTTELTAAQAEADAALSALEGVDRQYTDAFQSGTQVEDLKTQWRAIKAGAATLNPRQSAQQHEALITSIKVLTTHVGDASFLILDPDLDT